MVMYWSHIFAEKREDYIVRSASERGEAPCVHILASFVSVTCHAVIYWLLEDNTEQPLLPKKYQYRQISWKKGSHSREIIYVG